MSNHEPIRVVLADDHQVVRHGIRQLLIESGIEVVAEAQDGEEAIRLIEKHQPDVAVLDIRMPYYSGIEVARRIRGKNLAIGLLILTAFDDEPFILTALEAGANGFVLKTAGMEEIVEAIRAVNEGKSVLDPIIVPKLMHAIVASHGPKLPYEPLTDRELEVLLEAAHGLTNKAIGVKLEISDRTVQGHLRRIFEKLNAANRTEAVVIASELGLLEIPMPHETTSG